jgi:hypothetical protein
MSVGFAVRLVTTCVVFALAAGCKPRENAAPGKVAAPDTNGRLVGTTCELPLGVLCDTPGTCFAYPQALADVRSLKTNPKEWGSAETGTCGDGHYVKKSVWYMTERTYFDSGDKMIAAERSVDNLSQYCEGKAGHAVFGVVPACTLTPTEIVRDGGAH